MRQVLQATVATIIFALLLAVIYIFHANVLRVNVVFYSAIGDAIVATLLAGILLWKIKYFAGFTRFERIQMLLIWLLLGYSISISIPTVIDRSLSFYILEKLDQRGGGIKVDNFEDVFIKEYMPEHRLVDVRLTEQVESGTIYIENGCVKLTPKGMLLVRFSRYFRQNLLPKKRLLMGSYTDALTDPFRKSVEIEYYKCK